MAAYEVLLLNTAVPQIQAAQSGDTYVVPRDIAFSAALTLSAGTANGVAFLNGSKVLTTGSALTFDGTNLIQATGGAASVFRTGSTVSSGRAATFNLGNNAGVARATIALDAGTELMTIGSEGNFPVMFQVNGSETMRLTSTGLKASIAGTNADPVFSYTSDTNTGIFFPAADKLGFVAGGGSDQMVLTSTGLGIGTSSPGTKLDVVGVVRALGAGPSLISVEGDNQLYAAVQLQATSSGGKNWSVVSNATSSPLGAAGSLSFRDSSIGTTHMTLDSSGNLGLGVTPPSTATINTINLGRSASGIQGFSSGSFFNTANAFWASGGWTYGSNGHAFAYGMNLSNNTHEWFTAPSGTAGNLITTFTQAMTLSSDGTFRVKGAGTAGTTDAFQVAGTAPADAARITSGGSLLVGTTAEAGYLFRVAGGSSQFYATAAANFPVHVWNSAASGDNGFVNFYTDAGTTLRGSIDYDRTGGLVRYNTTSDYRAKDIIGPLQNVGATIDALKVYEGKMKGATQSRPMLVAHEAQEHAPYAVTGEKDAVNEDGTPKYQQMDVSSLVPLLLAEIQSLRARVAQLEQGA